MSVKAREKLLMDALHILIAMGERHGRTCGDCRDKRRKADKTLAQFNSEDHQ